MSVDVSSNSPPPAASTSTSFLGRLGSRVERVRSYLCVGIDPDPAALPAGFSPDVAGIEAFSRLVIEAASPYAAAFKANVAFFEAFGSDGIVALERVRAAIPSDIPFIADAKRGDVSSTVARQAAALFDSLGADAVTANPYLGREAIEPLLDRTDRFVYVLCRTSNPGAGEFQDLVIDVDPLFVHVARRVAAWQAGGDQVGLVVGATAPSEMATIRSAAPTLPILVPGLGAQGGDLAAVLAYGPATAPPGSAAKGAGLLVNVSRGIASAALESADPGAALAAAARGWADRLPC
ncbi:MAG: orotidine-5'-phosphate decarboxylase [Chloroflexota bacterium]